MVPKGFQVNPFSFSQEVNNLALHGTNDCLHLPYTITATPIQMTGRLIKRERERRGLPRAASESSGRCCLSLGCPREVSEMAGRCTRAWRSSSPTSSSGTPLVRTGGRGWRARWAGRGREGRRNLNEAFPGTGGAPMALWGAPERVRTGGARGGGGREVQRVAWRVGGEGGRAAGCAERLRSAARVSVGHVAIFCRATFVSPRPFLTRRCRRCPSC